MRFMIFCGLMLGLCAVVFGSEPASAPGALQVWNVEPWQTVAVGDFTGTNPEMKALKPVDLLGTRNGVCSGFVVVTRDGAAIKGLKAEVGDLAQSGGGNKRIPAARVQVRFADIARPETSWMPPHRFDRLLETAPAEVSVATAKAGKAEYGVTFTPKSIAPVATVPVWVTVRVPADAPAGNYDGKLTITAEGLAATTVPVKLKVHDWAMPAPRDFKVRTIGWMNPEVLAKHYNNVGLQVPLWSEKHFELMGRSMAMMLELGSRHVVIDVTKDYPARDNTDTMVKWIKQPDGSYTYDFTLFDKYCDLVANVIGKPFPVRISIWRGPRPRDQENTTYDFRNATVLVVDPASGQVSDLAAPTKFGSEEMRIFWKPFLDALRPRLEKRGWFDVTALGWMCYCWSPNKEMASMVKSIWPDGKWADMTHGRVLKYETLEKGVFVPVMVGCTVWGEGTLDVYAKWKSGPYPRQYAGRLKPDTAYCTHARVQYREQGWPALWKLRTKHEEALLKGNDGLEAVGADYFPVKDARGRYTRGRWVDFAQGPGAATSAILGAGDTGPIGTERFEAMREGIQLCEAMVFIQKAIEAQKLSGDLETRANQVLDDRAKAVAASSRLVDPKFGSWFFEDFAEYPKGARERDDLLYATAAEVARAVAGK